VNDTGPPRPPVMADVAKLAGVSHQTVSRVLNNNPNVSASTRQRVEEAIATLAYRRNTAARSLVTRRSQTIGVLAAEMASYGPSNTVLAVQHAAREAGYFVSIAGLRDVTRETINEAVGHFLEQAVDGIVVLLPHPGALDTLRELVVGVPMVVVGAAVGDAFGSARVDQRLGAELAVRHLVEQGHTRIGHLSGPRDWIDADERTEGWRDALKSAGLSAELLLPGDWGSESGYRAGLQLAERRTATAIFVANDQMALGLLRALAESGIHVPDDLSVVGFDDQPESAYFLPPLTTVRQNFQELGVRCIQLLLRQLGGGEQDSAVVRPELVVRQSTAPPAA
jgi:DNA-binding LacI/PurR family transcriptional regulator